MSLIQRSAWLAWLILLVSAVGLLFLMGDSKPPFRMISATTNTPKAGEVLRADVIVERELKRRCSVTFSRHMFDSIGTRVDITPSTFMPADGLDQLDAEKPGTFGLPYRCQVTSSPARPSWSRRWPTSATPGTPSVKLRF